MPTILECLFVIMFISVSSLLYLPFSLSLFPTHPVSVCLLILRAAH